MLGYKGRLQPVQSELASHIRDVADTVAVTDVGDVVDVLAVVNVSGVLDVDGILDIDRPENMLRSVDLIYNVLQKVIK